MSCLTYDNIHALSEEEFQDLCTFIGIKKLGNALKKFREENKSDKLYGIKSSIWRGVNVQAPSEIDTRKLCAKLVHKANALNALELFEEKFVSTFGKSEPSEEDVDALKKDPVTTLIIKKALGFSIEEGALSKAKEEKERQEEAERAEQEKKAKEAKRDLEIKETQKEIERLQAELAREKEAHKREADAAKEAKDEAKKAKDAAKEAAAETKKAQTAKEDAEKRLASIIQRLVPGASPVPGEGLTKEGLEAKLAEVKAYLAEQEYEKARKAIVELYVICGLMEE